LSKFTHPTKIYIFFFVISFGFEISARPVSYGDFFHLQDVHEYLQEDEDHEGIRSKRPWLFKGVKRNL
jgi:hypothetical protein